MSQDRYSPHPPHIIQPRHSTDSFNSSARQEISGQSIPSQDHSGARGFRQIAPRPYPTGQVFPIEPAGHAPSPLRSVNAPMSPSRLRAFGGLPIPSPGEVNPSGVGVPLVPPIQHGAAATWRLPFPQNLDQDTLHLPREQSFGQTVRQARRSAPSVSATTFSAPPVPAPSHPLHHFDQVIARPSYPTDREQHTDEVLLSIFAGAAVTFNSLRTDLANEERELRRMEYFARTTSQMPGRDMETEANSLEQQKRKVNAVRDEFRIIGRDYKRYREMLLKRMKRGD